MCSTLHMREFVIDRFHSSSSEEKDDDKKACDD